jgi:beta-glucanase (GH16 family)
MSKSKSLRAACGAMVIASAVALIALGARPSHATPPSGYTLKWSDEFNGAVGSSPSSANWSFDTGGGGWGNNELETYVTDTAHAEIVSDSAGTDGKVLQITATKSGNTYESARIKTQGKEYPTYGYIEARVKNPTGQGIWPAFWMLGEEFNGSNWPQCGEMDIMELFGNKDGTNMGSFHMGTASKHIDWTASYTLAGGAQFSQAYHTFGLLWTSTAVTDYVDGVQYETHPSSSPGWIFNKPYFFLINLAVGGSPPGNPNSSTSFPQHLNVDYVRVYEP